MLGNAMTACPYKLWSDRYLNQRMPAEFAKTYENLLTKTSETARL